MVSKYKDAQGLIKTLQEQVETLQSQEQGLKVRLREAVQAKEEPDQSAVVPSIPQENSNNDGDNSGGGEVLEIDAAAGGSTSEPPRQDSSELLARLEKSEKHNAELTDKLQEVAQSYFALKTKMQEGAMESTEGSNIQAGDESTLLSDAQRALAAANERAAALERQFQEEQAVHESTAASLREGQDQLKDQASCS